MFKEYKNKKSTNRRNSRYVQGGTIEESSNRIGWWERRTLLPSPKERTVTITPETQNRPDIIANKYLGNSEYEWIILQYNNIIDINEEFDIGAVIKIPDSLYVQTMVLNKAALL